MGRGPRSTTRTRSCVGSRVLRSSPDASSCGFALLWSSSHTSVCAVSPAREHAEPQASMGVRAPSVSGDRTRVFAPSRRRRISRHRGLKGNTTGAVQKQSEREHTPMLTMKGSWLSGPLAPRVALPKMTSGETHAVILALETSFDAQRGAGVPEGVARCMTRLEAAGDGLSHAGNRRARRAQSAAAQGPPRATTPSLQRLPAGLDHALQAARRVARDGRGAPPAAGSPGRRSIVSCPRRATSRPSSVATASCGTPVPSGSRG